MRAQTPSPKSVPVRNDDGGACWPPCLRRIAVQLAHDELKEEQRGFGRLAIVREISLDPFLFLTAERRVYEDHVNPVFLPDLGELEAERIAGVDVRRVEPMQ